jgi:multiple sugar transport system permease protein
MAKNERFDNRTALFFVLPFVAVYGLLFVYPTLQMVALSLTDSHLIVPGKWVGLDNYLALFHDWRMRNALVNTALFVLFTAIPGTAVALLIAMMLSRLKGRVQAIALALFFLPYVLPVSVVIIIWDFLLSRDSGVLQYIIIPLVGHRVPVFSTVSWVLPISALITVWWTSGFNILLFLAGLRNIPPELYEAASIDNASRWAKFRLITWPLIWPVTALVLAVQLILQIKIFDQIFLVTGGGQVDATLVLVQYIYSLGFQKDQGGYAATVAVALFIIVIAASVLQFQLLRARGRK